MIERVTFHNDESGFCVLRVKTPGHREETTVIGSLPSVTAGEWLVAEGSCWVRDKEHGLQFKARTLKTVPPTTADGIERYLGSGLVKGIGPVLAKKLVGRFGAEVLAVDLFQALLKITGAQILLRFVVGSFHVSIKEQYGFIQLSKVDFQIIGAPFRDMLVNTFCNTRPLP